MTDISRSDFDKSLHDYYTEAFTGNKRAAYWYCEQADKLWFRIRNSIEAWLEYPDKLHPLSDVLNSSIFMSPLEALSESKLGYYIFTDLRGLLKKYNDTEDLNDLLALIEYTIRTLKSMLNGWAKRGCEDKEMFLSAVESAALIISSTICSLKFFLACLENELMYTFYPK